MSVKTELRAMRKLHSEIVGMKPGLVTVCDKCLRASCWQGHFYCGAYKRAGTVQKTRGELRKLKLENPVYWKTDRQIADA